MLTPKNHESMDTPNSKSWTTRLCLCPGSDRQTDAAHQWQVGEEGCRRRFQAGPDLHGRSDVEIVSHAGSSGSGVARLERYAAAGWDFRAAVSADDEQSEAVSNLHCRFRWLRCREWLSLVRPHGTAFRILSVILTSLQLFTFQHFFTHRLSLSHHIFTVVLWAQNSPFQKILSSTLVCFCLSDWSHPFAGFICSLALCFSLVSVWFQLFIMCGRLSWPAQLYLVAR